MAQFNKNTHSYLDQAKTLYEVVMLADQYGNMVGPANPTGMAVDAFGRARTSQPVTLFDSFNRYQINGGFSTANSATASATYAANSSTVLLNVDTTSGAYAKRETTRVFAYQPGKSLQVMSTFVMNAPKVGLTQRVGYFNDSNGVFLNQSGANTVSFILRSNTSGTPSENPALQANWNMDPLDGTGPSKKILDLTKSQILFFDIEWLGVGSVRAGFVIDGQLIHCHSFHHANLLADVYMTTACLPVRYEIFNTATTDSASTLKQSCSTVVSEGGYDLRGRPRTIGHPVQTLYTLTTAGTAYPLVTLRLKADRLDAIVVPKEISILGDGNATRYQWRLVQGGSVSGGSGTWVSAGATDSVEYKLDATTLTGGTVVASGYVGITNQSSSGITLSTDLFKFQLERDGLTSTPTLFTLALVGATAGDKAVASIDWQEIT